MSKQYKELKQLIDDAKHICFFTGAGMSTESGIPDFRSQNGLYRQNKSFVDIVAADFYEQYPHEFWPLFKEIFHVKMLHQYKANTGHRFIAELEEAKTVHVITQNIDGLHQDAGSTNVFEIHGSIKRAHCPNCKEEYDLAYLNQSALPQCTACERLLKPNVVLFGDAIHQFDEAVTAALSSDLFIVLGSSLEVAPINQIPLLVSRYNRTNMVMINKEPTHYDYLFDLVIYDSIGQVVANL